MNQQEMEKKLIAITQQLLADSGESFSREIKMDALLSRHLGIDSLGRAELFARIEKEFNVSLPPHLLLEADTLKNIADYLAQAEPAFVHTKEHKVIVEHGEKNLVDPSHANTLIHLLLLYAEQSPTKKHIYFQHDDGKEEVITYGELFKKALQVAAALRGYGLKEGDTVAIMLPTHPGFFYTFFGTLLAGGIPVPIYPPFRAHMLEAYAQTEARILNNAQVRFFSDLCTS